MSESLRGRAAQAFRYLRKLGFSERLLRDETMNEPIVLWVKSGRNIAALPEFMIPYLWPQEKGEA
jgi:hypothetical protein